MSIICSGFPTNLMHFCYVISRSNKIQRKYRSPLLCQSPPPAHGGQPSAGSPRPTVGSTRPTVGSTRPTVGSTRPTVGLSGLALLIQLDPISWSDQFICTVIYCHSPLDRTQKFRLFIPLETVTKYIRFITEAIVRSGFFCKNKSHLLSTSLC